MGRKRGSAETGKRQDDNGASMNKIHINIQNVCIHAYIHRNIHILYVDVKCPSQTNPLL